MFVKILVAVVIALVVLLGYVSTRNDYFKYEKSGVINAPAEKIFPYLSQFKLGHEWSPYEKGIEMPKKFSGTDGAIGSWMEFGPSKSGSGKLTILDFTPNKMVKINLQMTAPFKAENIVMYQLTPEGNGTRFTWSMEGRGGFMGKLITLFIDCEKMATSQFSEGIQNLKTLVESQNTKK